MVDCRIMLMLLVAAAVPALTLAEPSAVAQPAPNIVLIVADDLGYADLSFLPYAASDAETPNIDRMAKGGAFFSNAYVTSPICSASRAGIITGRYQQRWGNYSLGIRGRGLPASELTIPQALKELGYVTMKVGKNHHGGGDADLPWKHGFDEFLGFTGSTKDYLRLSEQEAEALGKDANNYLISAGPLVHWKHGQRRQRSFDNAYSTDVFTEAAVEFIRRDHGSRPFYLQVSFNAVHHPQYQVKRELLSEMGIPQLMWTPESGLSPGQWHERHGWLGEIDPHGRARYLACARVMDEGVGQIIRTLREERIEKRTLVTFISDNGGSQNTYACNGPLHGNKYMLGEGGVRVPLILYWPDRIPAGKVLDTPVMSLDCFPTFVAAAQGTPPNTLDGKDLLPVVDGMLDGPLHEFICWDQSTDAREDWAIRKGNWKLRQSWDGSITRTYCGGQSYGRKTKTVNGLTFYDYPAQKGTLLYNLKKDIGESRNQSLEFPEKVRELQGLYRQWSEQMPPPRKR